MNQQNTCYCTANPFVQLTKSLFVIFFLYLLSDKVKGLTNQFCHLWQFFYFIYIQLFDKKNWSNRYIFKYPLFSSNFVQKSLFREVLFDFFFFSLCVIVIIKFIIYCLQFDKIMWQYYYWFIMIYIIHMFNFDKILSM